MYRKLLCCLLAVLMVFVSGGVRFVLPVEAEELSAEKNVPTDASATKRDFTDSEVLVAMTHEESMKFTTYTAADFSEIGCASVKDLSSAKAEKIQKVLRGEKLEEDSIGAAFMNRNINVDNFHTILSLKLSKPGKENVLRAVALLNQRADVYIAEPNYIFQMAEPTRGVVPPADLPVYGWAAEKINQEEAWEIETGSASVLVGVIDSGIDAGHPELYGKVHPEKSCDFVGDGYTATSDPHGHGTHVAGIIGAKHNNDSLNFSGVCQAVTLVSLRVTAADGYSNTERISNALVYAESCDIPIVNISMGLDGLRDLPAIVNLTVLDYTGLIISCAGNKNEGLYEHIADLPEGWETDRIIIVGASTSADAKWSWSNYDEEMVDLFAPGDAVLSCYSRLACSISNCSSDGHVTYGYHNLSGTSMAAPFVTGVAALILAHKPNITYAGIKDIICDSVDKVSSLFPYCVEDGRLNAYKAMIHEDLHTVNYYEWEDTTYHTVCWSDCGVSILEEHSGPLGAHRCSDCGGMMDY